MADNLTWLARNAHLWPEIVPGRAFAAAFAVEGLVEWLEYPPVDWDGCYQKHEWLARRSELQNKPSWKDAPQDASYLAQEPHGMWTFFFDRPYEPSKLSEDGWRFDGFQAWCSECRGEVLGDWRDTLERRPVDLSEPAVTARLTEATENVLAAAPALMDEKFSIDRNGWFERGGLPPVGAKVQWRPGSMGQWEHERWVDVDVIAHAGDGDIVIKWDGEAGNNKQLVTASQEAFRPIRTERDQAVDEMMKCTLGVMNQETQRRLFEDLYDAGYRKQNLPAK